MHSVGVMLTLEYADCILDYVPVRSRRITVFATSVGVMLTSEYAQCWRYADLSIACKVDCEGLILRDKHHVIRANRQ